LVLQILLYHVICAVFGEIHEILEIVDSLHPRWHLSRHPKFQDKLHCLGLQFNALTVNLEQSTINLAITSLCESFQSSRSKGAKPNITQLQDMFKRVMAFANSSFNVDFSFTLLKQLEGLLKSVVSGNVGNDTLSPFKMIQNFEVLLERKQIEFIEGDMN
jgi:hypothetical protein